MTEQQYLNYAIQDAWRQYITNPYLPYNEPIPLHAYQQRQQRPLPQQYQQWHPQQYQLQAYSQHPLPQQYTRRTLLPQQQQYQRYTQIPIQNIQPESVDKFCRRHKYVKIVSLVSNIPKVHKDLKKFDIKLKRSSRLSPIPES